MPDGPVARARRTVHAAAQEPPGAASGFLCIGLAPDDHAAAITVMRRLLDDPPPRPPYPVLGSVALRLARTAGEAGNEVLAMLWAGLVTHQQLFHREPGPVVVPGTTLATVVINGLLTQSDRDLATVASRLGYNPRPFEAWALQTSEAVNRRLWDPGRRGYASLDTSTGTLRPVTAVEEAAALYAAIPDRSRARSIVNRLERETGEPEDPGDPIALWMAVRGLDRYGYRDLAAQLATRSAAPPESDGTGDPIGAAVFLDLRV